MKEILDKIFNFIEKHNKFIKRIIIFFVAYFTISIVNNPTFTLFFNQMFGDIITTGIQAVPATILCGMVGD